MNVTICGEQKEIPIRSLPEEFIKWQCETRIQRVKGFKTGAIPNLGPHSPGIASVSTEGEFPINRYTSQSISNAKDH